MDAEPELAAQAATPGVEQDSQAGANQSRLRETIESIKQSASANQSEEAKKERKKEATEWLVVLYNDDVHSFAYVTETLAKVVPLLSREVAYTIATEAHNTGEAAVVRTWKAKAEAYCTG
ncbi:ATP-dependent Clp protease adaptor protein ClpS, putative [Babesia caballi]|uniref:ATP-dependent Clp protease adaptor protein ClpS, putative n=1 Tax=Babesia caballi TaxID=5871 RepID=A0AAV4M2V0_BABCB|nr:ATP-dependent Clp protease adaptor protein ClpS, putative [Babesia caballi]